MRALSWAAVVVVAMAMARCASAPPPLTPAQIPAPHYDCKRENSLPLDLDRFAARSATYAGHCVYARGFKIAGFFYPDLRSFYSGWSGPHSAIGVFGNRDADFSDARQTIELTALAYSCAEWNHRSDKQLEQENLRLSERDPGVSLVASGQPCTAFIGLDSVLLVSEWRPIPGIQRRLSGEDAARKYGNLLEVTDDWQHAAEVKQVARDWFDAVRRQDAQQFVHANGWSDDERAPVIELLSSGSSPLRFLFGMTAEPTIKFLRTKPNPPADGPNVVYALEFRAYGCVCKTPDCMDQWPIVSDDTDLDDEWPYFCLEIVRDNEGQTYVPGGTLYRLIQ